MTNKSKMILERKLISFIGEGLSIDQLIKSTEAGFPNTHRSTSTGMSVRNFSCVMNTNASTLDIKSDVKGSTDVYTCSMRFSGVEFGDKPFDHSVEISDPSSSDSVFIEPIDPKEHHVRLKCNCKDFTWRFSRQNQKQDALDGDVLTGLTSKGLRPPANPTNSPGMCKHLRFLFNHINGLNLVKK